MEPTWTNEDSSDKQTPQRGHRGIIPYCSTIYSNTYVNCNFSVSTKQS